jgi:nucleoside-diphosphate-sugar epimerase
MKILLTGGTGFIGQHVIKLLAQSEHQVCSLYRSNALANQYKNIHWLQSQMHPAEWSSIEGCLNGMPEAIIHLAAKGVNPVDADLEDCFLSNVLHPLLFWEQAINRGVNRIILCGSCFEYGATCSSYDYVPVEAAPMPLNAYAASKASATMALSGLVASKDIQGIVLRPCVVYGDGEPDYRLYPSLKKAALNNQDFPMTEGTQVRDFINVTSVAQALVDSLSRTDLDNGKLKLENLSGQVLTVAQFASQLWAELGASGNLLLGVKPSRPHEMPRMVPRAMAT